MLDEGSLLSIHQFSEMSGVNQSTLRYYDHINLFSPASRGRNNYRYYLPHQIITINFITVLSELGVPLTKIKDLTKNRTPHHVLDLLMEREQALDRELKILQSTYTLIHTFQRNIQSSERVDIGKIEIVNRDVIPIIMGSVNDWTNNATFYKPFSIFCREMALDKNHLHYPVGGYFDNMENFIASPAQPDRFFSADPNGNDKIASGNYIIAHVKGYYGEMGDSIERISDFATVKNIQPKGPVYITYLLNEVSLVEENEYLAQVAVKIV
ncbi:MAG: MerR family transcriptional regulator [Turicibacter sp.]|nr:MerR family transcriptional regulator [Turicibacter sp.]